MSDLLPDEVVTDHILGRLPVRSLLRCRSVCKQWRSVIDSPEFIKFRIDQDSATSDDFFLLTKDFDSCIYSIPNSSCSNQTTSPDILLPQCHYPCPYPRDVAICGSSHGLVCLVDIDEPTIIFIFNPAIRKHYVTLAPVPDEFKSSWRYDGYPDFRQLDGYGFGYDPVSKDYKFVRLCVMANRLGRYKSEVVSFGIRSETSRVAGLPYYHSNPIQQELGVLVGGALHWLFGGRRENNLIIVAYDLGTNQCRKIRLPDQEDAGLKLITSLIKLVELRNCLCLCLCDSKEAVVHVWMMKEYGVKTSWSKLFSVRDLGCLTNLSSSMVVPLWLSMDGDEVVLHLDGGRLLWYDTKKERPRRVMYLDVERQRFFSGPWKRKRSGISLDAIPCLGSSLVRPDGK